MAALRRRRWRSAAGRAELLGALPEAALHEALKGLCSSHSGAFTMGRLLRLMVLHRGQRCSGEECASVRLGGLRKHGPLFLGMGAASGYPLVRPSERDAPASWLRNWPRAQRRGGKRCLPVRVHEWLCMAAHGPPPKNKPHAVHACGNRACLRAGHLMWASARDNCVHRTYHSEGGAMRLAVARRRLRLVSPGLRRLLDHESPLRGMRSGRRV